MGDTIHSAVDLLPTFVAFAAPSGPAAAWRGACFAENEAVITLTPGPGGRNGTEAAGAVLHLKVPLTLPSISPPFHIHNAFSLSSTSSYDYF
jgi:hypothetical protein